jgi:hypothetical protein
MAAGASAEARARAEREKIRRLEASAERWERGAEGERKTAELLEPLTTRGYVVLHDLAVPGSKANVDHVVIGPSGVTVIDSKAYRAKLTINQETLWAGRWPQTRRLEALAFEAQAVQRSVDRVAPDVAVRRMVCVHGTAVPHDRDGVLGPVVLCGPDDLIAALTSPVDDPLPSSRVMLVATAIETLHGDRSPSAPPAPPAPSRPAAPTKRTTKARRTTSASRSASAGTATGTATAAARRSGRQLSWGAVALVGVVLCIAIAGYLISGFGSQITSFGTTRTTTPVTVEGPSS